MPDPDFSALTTADRRAVDRMVARLAEAPDLGTLGRELVHEMNRVLPADCMLWNQWTPSMDTILDFHANHEHLTDGLARHSEELNATIHHHPVIAAGHLDSAWLRPQRISDYQSAREFRRNPLFQEVYRHVDSHHQIALNAAKLDNSVIVLSWNLKHRDFSDREVQRLHLVGRRVGLLCRRIEEFRRLDQAWRTLAAALGKTGAFSDGLFGAMPCLGLKDGALLAGLIRAEPRAAIAGRLAMRRDSLDRHLAQLRERMGFESTSQLLQALAELRPHSFPASPPP